MTTICKSCFHPKEIHTNERWECLAYTLGKTSPLNVSYDIKIKCKCLAYLGPRSDN